MGRLPKPTTLKALEGTQRADRLNHAEPQAPALQIGARPPSWLRGTRRRQAWAELSALLRDAQVLTVLDALALAELVDAYGDYIEASDVVMGRACAFCGEPLTSKRRCTAPVAGHEGGRRYYTTVTDAGSLMIRPHPAMAIRANAWERIVKMLDRFGMAPAPRARVSAAKAEDHDPVAEFLDGRRRRGA